MPHIRKTLVMFALTCLLSLVGCGGGDPLASGSGQPGKIVVGSQDYYSNEIIAEIYAQALETAGYQVERQFRIGQREAYLPEVEAATIDLFPEYTGPLLQYWAPGTRARTLEEVHSELSARVPPGLRALNPSPATDQDSYVVTREFAERWGLTTIADLAKVEVPLVLGANSEAETRPHGPAGLAARYGITTGFAPIEDNGGPLTVNALKSGEIQLAVIYSADPSIAKNDLVVLQDPKGLFMASHVVPLASENVDETAAGIINQISAKMTTEELVALNARSVTEALPASAIAKDWLANHEIR